MSLVTDLLTRYVPKFNVDRLKATSATAVLSTLSSFLCAARTYFTNASILSSAFSQVFQLEPDFISDEVLAPVFAAADHIVAIADNANIQAMYNSLVEIFEKVGTPVTVGGLSYIKLQFVARGREFALLLNQTNEVISWYNESTGEIISNLLSKQTVSDVLTWSMNNTAYDIDSLAYSFWDLLHELAENADLSSALADLSSALTTVQDDATKISNLCVGWASSTFSSVRELGSRVRTAWATGGLYGVAMVIINFFQAGASATVSADGNLVFADNSALIPQAYTAGIADFVANTLSALASVVAAAFSRILGVVTGIIASMVRSIIQAINYDYSTETTASLIDDLKTGYPLAPHGLYAHKQQVNSVPLRLKLKFCESNGIWSFFVPGGCIIMTYVDGNASLEFHPDLIDRRGLNSIMHLFGVYSGSDVQAETYFTIPTTAALLTGINSYSAPVAAYVNNSDGVLSVSDDAAMLSIITFNILLFSLYCMTLIPNQPSKVYMRYNRANRQIIFNDSAGVPFVYSDHTQYGYSDLGAAAYGFQELIRVFLGIPVYDANWTGWEGIARYASYLSGDPDNYPSSSCITTDPNTNVALEWFFYPGVQNILSNTDVFGSPYQLPFNQVWGLKTPKYDRSTFIKTLVGLCLITAATAVVATVLTITVRNWVASRRALAAAKVESAWQTLADNPTKANAEAYVKAVRKNNFFANFIGGEKFSANNYWGQTSSGNVITAIGAQMSGLTEGNSALSSDSLVYTGDATSNTDDLNAKVNVLLPAWYHHS